MTESVSVWAGALSKYETVTELVKLFYSQSIHFIYNTTIFEASDPYDRFVLMVSS
jgi:hypothetical protein